MATLTFEQRQTKKQKVQEVNGTLNQMQQWLNFYDQFSVNDWKATIPGLESSKIITDIEKTAFLGKWEILCTELKTKATELIG